MSKISLIIGREYTSRVKKRSFILITILGPILMGLLLVSPFWLALKDKSPYFISVVDKSRIMGPLPPHANLHFEDAGLDLDKAKKDLYTSKYSAVIFFNDDLINTPKVDIYYKSPLSIEAQSYIKESVERKLYNYKLITDSVNIRLLDKAKTNVNIVTAKVNEDGTQEQTDTGVITAIGMGAGFLIYIFIFLYGVQVMRGVMEEKTNRIVELIVSSVKPFQLMIGKIIGVALVGLTQFLLWVILTFVTFTALQSIMLDKAQKDFQLTQVQKEEVFKKGADIQVMKMGKTVDTPKELLDKIAVLKNINFTEIIVCFLFYFLGGYLLYSALFAAMGAAADSETDTQQFVMPVSLPIIFSFIIAFIVVPQDPDGTVSTVFSMIPFTSPVVMMARIPFGVEPWQIAASLAFLVIGFIFTTWIAGRIYRTGILMYGKKVSYRELWKWLFYKG